MSQSVVPKCVVCTGEILNNDGCQFGGGLFVHTGCFYCAHCTRSLGAIPFHLISSQIPGVRPSFTCHDCKNTADSTDKANRRHNRSMSGNVMKPIASVTTHGHSSHVRAVSRSEAMMSLSGQSCETCKQDLGSFFIGVGTKRYHRTPECLLCATCKSSQMSLGGAVLPYAIVGNDVKCFGCIRAEQDTSSVVPLMGSVSTSEAKKSQGSRGVRSKDFSRAKSAKQLVRMNMMKKRTGAGDLSGVVAKTTSLKSFTIHVTDSLKKSIVFQPELNLQGLLLKIAKDRGLNPEVRQATLLSGEVIPDMDIKLKELGALEINYFIKKKVLTDEELLEQQIVSRKNIMEELLSTEDSYVAALNTVLEVFVIPLQQDAAKHEESILSKEHRLIIFSNISDLIGYHLILQAKLARVLKTWDKDTCVGDIFLSLFKSELADISFEQGYAHYTANFDQSRQLLQQYEEKQDGAFYEFCKVAALHNQYQGEIRNYLITPVQRLPRYILLLTDLLSNTPKSHPDHPALSAAVDLINKVAVKVNKATPNEASYVPQLERETHLKFGELFPKLRTGENFVHSFVCSHKGVSGMMWLTPTYVCWGSNKSKARVYIPLNKVLDIQMKGKSIRVVKRGVISADEVMSEELKFGEDSEPLDHSFHKFRTFWESKRIDASPAFAASPASVNPKQQRPATAKDFARVMLELGLTKPKVDSEESELEEEEVVEEVKKEKKSRSSPRKKRFKAQDSIARSHSHSSLKLKPSHHGDRRSSSSSKSTTALKSPHTLTGGSKSRNPSHSKSHSLTGLPSQTDKEKDKEPGSPSRSRSSRSREGKSRAKAVSHSRSSTATSDSKPSSPKKKSSRKMVIESSPRTSPSSTTSPSSSSSAPTSKSKGSSAASSREKK